MAYTADDKHYGELFFRAYDRQMAGHAESEDRRCVLADTQPRYADSIQVHGFFHKEHKRADGCEHTAHGHSAPDRHKLLHLPDNIVHHGLLLGQGEGAAQLLQASAVHFAVPAACCGTHSALQCHRE